MKKNKDRYTEPEANRRFLAALKAAVNTPPKPLNDKPKRKRSSKRR